MTRYSVLFLASLCALPGSRPCAAESFESRYWHALNAGRDLSPLIPTLEALTRAGNQGQPMDALREQAMGQLSEIQAADPLPSVLNQVATMAPQPGADWPSMGGGPTHSGATAEPGPIVGEEVWRYPVGWPWHATPRVEHDAVYTASPGLDTSMLCLDRRTGRRVWAAENPHWGFGRQSRAYSTVVPLGDEELAVWKESFDGWPLAYIVVAREDGRIVRRMPARPQETAYEQAERSPEHLLANRMTGGSEILVKSLKSGRTWWRFRTGYLPAAPVLAGERVYAAAEDGTLWALHLWGDQRVAWTYSIAASWGAAPVEHEGVLYAGANDGTVYTLDAASGQPRWQTPVARPDPRSRQLFSPVALANGRCYLGGTDGALYALDQQSGELLWEHACGDWIRAQPFVSGKTICVATLDGTVAAVEDRGARAKPRWVARPGRYPIYADLAGDADGVLVSTADLQIIALNIRDGKEQWRQSLINCTGIGEQRVFADSMPDIMQAPVTVAGGSVFFAGRNGFVDAEVGGRVSGTPTTRDGRVFVVQVGGNEHSYALDAETGQPLWSRQLGAVWAPPECDGDQLFIGNKQGVLHCLDPATGATHWERRFADGVYPAPTLDATTVYTGSWDGHYYALDRRDGSIRWAFGRAGTPYHVGGRPDSAAPVLADGKVIVPSLGGRMVALDAQTGRMLWEWKAKPWRICNVTAATDGTTVFASVFGNAYEWPFDVSLHGLDLPTGDELWEVAGLGGLTSPVATGGRRFVTGSMGSPFLSGYQMGDSPSDTPQLLWRLRTAGVMYESLPAVSGNLGFFLSSDGWLRAVR